MNAPLYLLDLSYEQLRGLFLSWNEPEFRAKQLFTWIYKKLATNFDQMSDLPEPLRRKLKESSLLGTLSLLEQRTSKDKQTRKMLFRLDDAKTIESTLMFWEGTGSSRERRTVCLSTQVGCAMGCPFCATGQQGFERNLRAGEIIEQVLASIRIVKSEHQANSDLSRPPITNVVFMGMGEPLANYDNVIQTIQVLNSKEGLNIGARQLTLSTAGLVPQIDHLAGENIRHELSVSLHAATDELRDRLVPLNRKYPLSKLMQSCRRYFEKTGRRVTFEYALFEGVNDSLSNAEELAGLIRGMNCSVNLILGDPALCREYRSSSTKQAETFQNELTRLKIASTVRHSRGIDIEAGCGQLKSRRMAREQLSEPGH